MIVYVETNFFLELSYLQERHDSCRKLLELAANNKISLAAPAFCVAEARSTWQRRASERREFMSVLQRHIREISRSAPFRLLSEQSKDLVAALVASGEEPRERLEEATAAFIALRTIIPLDASILIAAREYETLFSLSPQDALVLGSIRWHAGAEFGSKCFITQDAKGFANPSIYDELAHVECKVVVNFADALAYIENALRATG